MLTVHGIDISHHQSGRLDMKRAKDAGLKWLYHKATEGETYRDPMYAQRRVEAKKAGIPFGAYHFARASRGDAVREARAFISQAKPEPGDLRPALDLETSEGMTMSQVRVWARIFIAEVKRLTGVLPVVYTPYDLGNVTDGCILWRPRYNDRNTPPSWRWDIWQFSNGVLGVPDFFPGFGHVDLNVHRTGLTMDDMLIPKPPAVRLRERVLLMQISMQFSDSLAQKKADAYRIFTRARNKKAMAIFGTESLEIGTRVILRAAAAKHGFRFFAGSGQDAWFAVNRSFIDSGWETFTGPVIVPGKKGDHSHKKVTWVSFYNERIGRVTLFGQHLLTKGRPSAKDPEYRQHIEENRDILQATAKEVVKRGAGQAICFYGGDQNIVDVHDDTFMGAPLTSAWDELKKWQDTGHGNIDVIASYDRDGRVSAVSARSFKDKTFPLHTDHYLVEAQYDILVLKD